MPLIKRVYLATQPPVKALYWDETSNSFPKNFTNLLSVVGLSTVRKCQTWSCLLSYSEIGKAIVRPHTCKLRLWSFL